MKLFAVMLALLLLWGPAADAFTNPAQVTAGAYTAVAATGTAVSIGSAASSQRGVERLEIQNQCNSDVGVQFGGVPAVYGRTYLVPAGQTRVWDAADGRVPSGPYSLVTNGSTCSPDSQTGLMILEVLVR